MHPDCTLETLVAGHFRIFWLNPPNDSGSLNVAPNAKRFRAFIRELRAGDLRGYRRGLSSNERKMVRDSWGQDIAKTTVHVGKRKETKELVAAPQSQLIERHGLDPQLKSAKGAFSGIVVAGLSKTRGVHIRKVVLDCSEEKPYNFVR